MRRVLAALFVAAAACSSTTSDDAAASCPPVTPLAETAALPQGITLSRHGHVFQIEARDDYVGAAARSESPVVDLVVPLENDLNDSGYEVSAVDNEGFEAEIFFRRGEVAGVYRLSEGPCEGGSTIRLLYQGTDRP